MVRKKQIGYNIGTQSMKQLTSLGEEEKKIVTLKEANDWASQYLNRNITLSNISYLLQYGRIKRYGTKGDL